MTLEFDRRTCISQPEDYIRLYLPHSSSPVMSLNSQNPVPSKLLLLPGHTLQLTLESATNYAPQLNRSLRFPSRLFLSHCSLLFVFFISPGQLKRFGFECVISGYANPNHGTHPLAALRVQACHTWKMAMAFNLQKFTASWLLRSIIRKIARSICAEEF